MEKTGVVDRSIRRDHNRNIAIRYRYSNLPIWLGHYHAGMEERHRRSMDKYNNGEIRK